MERLLILVLDTSGSMNENAPSPDNDGDVVKAIKLVSHSVATIVEAMHQLIPKTKLAVIEFSTKARISQEVTDLQKSEKVKMLRALAETMTADGNTNMWEAIAFALNIANDSLNVKHECSAVDVFLFTDGLPSKETCPQRGMKVELKERFQSQFPLSNCFFHTFGFGPDIDSSLLFSLSEVGHGLFKYISDPGMVGTCLINSICKFIIDAKHSSNIPDSENPNSNNNHDSNVEIEDNSEHLQVLTDLLTFLGTTSKDNNNNNNKLDEARKLLNDGLNKINGNHPLTLDKEQLQIALSNGIFLKKWGFHYIRTLLSSHRHHHTGNFKDLGLQGYADEQFKYYQDVIEKIFKSIPPPRGSKVASMTAYVNPYGGCVDVNCSVKMFSNGSANVTKSAGDIRRGDVILSTNGLPAKVKWVLRNDNYSQRKLIQIGNSGLKITPWHPIRMNGNQGEWVFPANTVATQSSLNCESNNHHNSIISSVVTFALETTGCYSFFVDGIECVTLAHGIVDNDVLYHEFYGTEKVLRYIEKLHEDQKHISKDEDEEEYNYDGVVVDDVKLLRDIFENSNIWCHPLEARDGEQLRSLVECQ